MPPKPLPPRVAFSPGEFAALFGKSQTWGYRQIYSGKVNAITEYGRIQIPASEVERVLASASIYNGMPEKAPKAKAPGVETEKHSQNRWKEFMENRRRTRGKAETKGKLAKTDGNASGRSEALARLAGKAQK